MMKVFLAILLITIVTQSFALNNNAENEDIIAETQYGQIRGSIVQSTNRKPIYSFKSIPYAKKPVRFEAPKSLTPEDSWEEILDGTQNPPSCAQYLTNLSPASEDCLFLNVYTPIKPGTSNKKLNVMVFIHGGGFVIGDSVIYGPNRMLNNDIVLVVIHYRLGAFGFLSTGDEVLPGNNGLKDQTEALRWVQDNIQAFNGDKDQVTIFGESAGAVSVILQQLSPLAKGLFHKVIAQSGSPLSPWSMDKNPNQSAKRYAASVNCTTSSSAEMIACLRELPWEVLAKQTLINVITDVSYLKIKFEACSPVIEPDLPGAFLSQNPLEILQSGNYPQMPIVLGAVQHEGSAVLGAAFALSKKLREKLENPNFVQFDLLPTFLNALDLNESSIGSPSSQIIADYFIPADIRRDNFTDITDSLVNFLSVYLFKGSILRTADLMAVHSDEVYLYSFEREGFNSLWTIAFDLLGLITGTEPPPVKHGVMHADDLQYFWTIPFIISGNDRKVSNMVCKMWSDFATTGNPTPGEDWPKWTNYETKHPNYYKLDVEPELLLDYQRNNWRQGYQKK